MLLLLQQLQAAKANFFNEDPAPKDLEMQILPNTASIIDHEEAIAALARLLDLTPVQVSEWPGIRSYVEYVELAFEPLMGDTYAEVWSTLALQRPRQNRDCWQLLGLVAAVLRKDRTEDSSIDEIWTRVIHLQADTEPEHNTLGPDPCPVSSAMAVFAIICWITASMQPQLMLADEEGYPCLMVTQPEQHHQQRRPRTTSLGMDYVERPLYAVFRGLKHTMKTDRWRHAIGGQAEGLSKVLHMPSLNYASLHTIGKVRLVWVDDVTNHLHFDVANRELSIFKFPSLCGLLLVGGAGMPSTLRRSLAELYGTSDVEDLDTEPSEQVYREVLVSYRLLFAQSTPSRALMRQELQKLRQEDGTYDDLLDDICLQPVARGVFGLHPIGSQRIRKLPSCLWPISFRGPDGSLLEQSSYSTQDDFPLFGSRLAKLQEFSSRQEPSRLRDLWRDRRNPLQWYTFWAVLIVGGLSLLLAILQLIAGILQVVYTAQPPGG